MKVRTLPGIKQNPKTVLHQILEIDPDQVVILYEKDGKTRWACSSIDNVDLTWYAMFLLNAGLHSVPDD